MEARLNQFNLIGLFLLLIGTSILAGYPLTAQRDLDWEAKTYAGQNLFQVKNNIIKSYETKFGYGFFILGFACQAIGFFKASFIPLPLSPRVKIIVLIVVSIVLLKVSIYSVRVLSAKNYKPKMVEGTREMFSSILKNDVPQYTHERLEQISKLLDFPRKEEESDEEFIKRLEPIYEKH